MEYSNIFLDWVCSSGMDDGGIRYIGCWIIIIFIEEKLEVFEWDNLFLGKWI